MRPERVLPLFRPHLLDDGPVPRHLSPGPNSIDGRRRGGRLLVISKLPGQVVGASDSVGSSIARPELFSSLPRSK